MANNWLFLGFSNGRVMNFEVKVIKNPDVSQDEANVDLGEKHVCVFDLQSSFYTHKSFQYNLDHQIKSGIDEPDLTEKKIIYSMLHFKISENNQILLTGEDGELNVFRFPGIIK